MNDEVDTKDILIINEKLPALAHWFSFMPRKEPLLLRMNDEIKVLL